jgi:hypothetical protein
MTVEQVIAAARVRYAVFLRTTNADPECFGQIPVPPVVSWNNEFDLEAVLESLRALGVQKSTEVFHNHVV